MKAFRTDLLVIALVTVAAFSRSADAAETGVTRRYTDVRAKIDALFKHRDTPPAPITYADNPFLRGAVFTGLSAASTGDGNRAPAAPAPQTPRLEQIVAAFSITGLVQQGGVNHLIINQLPRREGDVIRVTWQGSPMFVRITRIGVGVVTFQLEDETATLRY